MTTRSTNWPRGVFLPKQNPRPPGNEVKPDKAIATKYGNVIVGPPR
ncbi:hypothetical protein [Kribbella sp. NPDC051620]